MGRAPSDLRPQEGVKLQVYVRQDAVGEEQFAVYKKLDAGDIIGIEGYMFRTRTGELTVRAQKLEFLAKAIPPMPEKWHGLQDVETRYRQRYLDLIANPDVRRVFIQRNKMISALRATLERHSFVEVETPMMQPVYGGRRAGAAFRHPSQRARHRPVPAHRTRTLHQAPDCRWARSGLRNQPQLPQRRHLVAAQPRVHDARVLSGL